MQVKAFSTSCARAANSKTPPIKANKVTVNYHCVRSRMFHIYMKNETLAGNCLVKKINWKPAETGYPADNTDI